MQRAQQSQQWIRDVCQQSAQRDKTESVSRAMVSFLKPNELAQFVVSRSLRVELGALAMLDGKLGELHNGNLQQLAHKYDPCGRLLSAFARRRRVIVAASHRSSPVSARSASGSSCKYSSCSELNALLQPPLRGDSLSYLLLFFVKILLELSSRKQSDCLHAEDAARLLDLAAEAVQNRLPSTPTHRRRPVRRPLCSGRAGRITAVLEDGRLRTWDAHVGRGAVDTPAYEQSTVHPESGFGLLRNIGVTILSVACGAEHMVAITNSGVYSWGSSRYGQLGIGTVVSTDTPTRIPEFACVDIACGHHHTLAISEDGRLWAWGRGHQGQLGLGSFDNASRPAEVACLGELEVIAACAGQEHSVVLTSEGDVYSFGCSSYGQLGTGDQGVARCLPVPIVLLDEPVRLIATHSFHSVAVTSSNAVYTWGVSPSLLEEAARSLQATRDIRVDGSCEYESVSCFLAAHAKPRKVSAHVPGIVVQITCSSTNTVALTSTGQLYSWGSDITKGQCLKVSSRPTATGPGRRGDKTLAGTSENEEPAIIFATCGADFCAALDDKRRILAWCKGRSMLNAQDSVAAAAVASDNMLSATVRVLTDPVNNNFAAASTPALPSLANTGFPSNNSRAAEVAAEKDLIELSGHASYSLRLIPYVAKLYGDTFPMAAVQAALAKQGALDVIAALLLIQERYETAFQCHMQALLTCRHRTTSAFAQFFASTVDFYRRLTAFTESTCSDQNVTYMRILSKAATFAASNGIRIEDLRLLYSASPSPRSITPSTQSAGSPAASISEPRGEERSKSSSKRQAVDDERRETPTKRTFMSVCTCDEEMSADDSHSGSSFSTSAPSFPLADQAVLRKRTVGSPCSLQQRCRPVELQSFSPTRHAMSLKECDGNLRTTHTSGDGISISCSSSNCSSDSSSNSCYDAAWHQAGAGMDDNAGDDMPTDLSLKGRRCQSQGRENVAEVCDPAVATQPADHRPIEKVEFCCGHSFLRQSFINTVLPRFVLQASRNAMLNSCSRMMLDMYQRTDICALACPDCVATAVGRL